MKNLRKRFIKMYANIPMGARNEIVAVVGDTTFTYSQLFNSINSLDKVDRALENMERMEIL
jgi:hypothetical protein